jgi:hypothetical protein
MGRAAQESDAGSADGGYGRPDLCPALTPQVTSERKVSNTRDNRMIPASGKG